MIESGFIYVLIDPRNGEIRYCGQTAYGLRTRMWKHCSDARKFRKKRHLANWLCELLGVGLLPKIEAIEVVEISDCFSGPILRDPQGRPSRVMEKMERDLVAARLHAREIFHIARLRAEGCDLTNATIGGQGTLGRKASPEAIEKTRQSHLGRKRAPEVRTRMQIAALARDKSTFARGENGSGAKLSDVVVREIFLSDEPGVLLAPKVGVGSSYIAQIRCGKKRSEATMGLQRPTLRKKFKVDDGVVAAIVKDDDFQWRIAEKYGVSQAYVSCIKRGVTRQYLLQHQEA